MLDVLSGAVIADLALLAQPGRMATPLAELKGITG
jgi:hypothetical protein